MTGGAVLLAAGYSRRFGSDKRRHRLRDGTPLLITSTKLYAAAFAELIVVLRPEDDELATALEDAQSAVRVVRCAEAHLGMGHSLACGVRAAAHWQYLFVALGDMAWVRPATLKRLRTALEGAPANAIVQPVHRGTPGHPVGFGARHFPRLAALTGDQGARTVVQAAGKELMRLDVPDPGVLEDLDTPGP